MSNVIRKISIGADYKDSMRFVINRSVLQGKFTISSIQNTESKTYEIYVSNSEDEIFLWKKIEDMPVIVEYRSDFSNESNQ